MTSCTPTERRRLTKRALLPITAALLVAAWILQPSIIQSHDTESTTTTVFDREIVRILNARCVSCHSENAASFALITYEETWFRARSIKMAALSRHMPPWPAMPGYGRFSNENGLTAREIEFLVSWADGGGPRDAGRVFLNVQESLPAARPRIQAHADFGRWHIGEPDSIWPLAPIRIESGEMSAITRTVVDPGFTAERWVRGMEYMPGDRAVVRSAVFTVEETGQWLGSWTPWYGFVNLPAGTAYALAPGSHIVAEIRTKGGGAPVVERGVLGLTFADQKPANVPSDLVLDARAVMSTDASFRKVQARKTLDQDTFVLALQPDLPGAVAALEVSARRPDGGTNILLFARDLRADWPTPYILEDPAFLPKGSELAFTAYIGNAVAVAASPVRLVVSRYDRSPVR